MRSIKCPQCGSECGPVVCRFSSVSHADYFKRWNDGVASIARGFQSRPDHDMRCDGMPLKAGT